MADNTETIDKQTIANNKLKQLAAAITTESLAVIQRIVNHKQTLTYIILNEEQSSSDQVLSKLCTSILKFKSEKVESSTPVMNTNDFIEDISPPLVNMFIDTVVNMTKKWLIVAKNMKNS
jgi:hypothetical protein